MKAPFCVLCTTDWIDSMQCTGWVCCVYVTWCIKHWRLSFFSNSHKKWIWLSFLCARVCVCRSNSLLVFVPNKKVNCFLTALLRLASFPIQSPISWCYCSFLWKSKLEFVILEEFEFEGRRRRKRRKDEANEKVAWKRVVNMGCSSHWAQRFPQQLLLFLLRVGGCVYNLCY